MFLWLFMPPFALASRGCALLPSLAIALTWLFDIDAKPRLLVLSFMGLFSYLLICLFSLNPATQWRYKHFHYGNVRYLIFTDAATMAWPPDNFAE
jgi:hypothetical protein